MPKHFNLTVGCDRPGCRVKLAISRPMNSYTEEEFIQEARAELEDNGWRIEGMNYQDRAYCPAHAAREDEK